MIQVFLVATLLVMWSICTSSWSKCYQISGLRPLGGSSWKLLELTSVSGFLAYVTYSHLHQTSHHHGFSLEFWCLPSAYGRPPQALHAEAPISSLLATHPKSVLVTAPNKPSSRDATCTKHSSSETTPSSTKTTQKPSPPQANEKITLVMAHPEPSSPKPVLSPLHHRQTKALANTKKMRLPRRVPQPSSTHKNVLENLHNNTQPTCRWLELYHVFCCLQQHLHSFLLTIGIYCHTKYNQLAADC